VFVHVIGIYGTQPVRNPAATISKDFSKQTFEYMA